MIDSDKIEGPPLGEKEEMRVEISYLNKMVEVKLSNEVSCESYDFAS